MTDDAPFLLASTHDDDNSSIKHGGLVAAAHNDESVLRGDSMFERIACTPFLTLQPIPSVHEGVLQHLRCQVPVLDFIHCLNEDGSNDENTSPSEQAASDATIEQLLARVDLSKLYVSSYGNHHAHAIRIWKSSHDRVSPNGSNKSISNMTIDSESSSAKSTASKTLPSKGKPRVVLSASKLPSKQPLQSDVMLTSGFLSSQDNVNAGSLETNSKPVDTSSTIKPPSASKDCVDSRIDLIMNASCCPHTLCIQELQMLFDNVSESNVALPLALKFVQGSCPLSPLQSFYYLYFATLGFANCKNSDNLSLFISHYDRLLDLFFSSINLLDMPDLKPSTLHFHRVLGSFLSLLTSKCGDCCMHSGHFRMLFIAEVQLVSLISRLLNSLSKLSLHIPLVARQVAILICLLSATSSSINSFVLDAIVSGYSSKNLLDQGASDCTTISIPYSESDNSSLNVSWPLFFVLFEATCKLQSEQWSFLDTPLSTYHHICTAMVDAIGSNIKISNFSLVDQICALLPDHVECMPLVFALKLQLEESLRLVHQTQRVDLRLHLIDIIGSISRCFRHLQVSHQLAADHLPLMSFSSLLNMDSKIMDGSSIRSALIKAQLPIDDGNDSLEKDLANLLHSLGVSTDRSVALFLRFISDASLGPHIKARCIRELCKMLCHASNDPLLDNTRFVDTISRQVSHSSALIRDAALEFVSLMILRGPTSQRSNCKLLKLAIDHVDDDSGAVKRRVLKTLGILLDKQVFVKLDFTTAELASVRAALICEAVDMEFSPTSYAGDQCPPTTAAFDLLLDQWLGPLLHQRQTLLSKQDAGAVRELDLGFALDFMHATDRVRLWQSSSSAQSSVALGSNRSATLPSMGWFLRVMFDHEKMIGKKGQQQQQIAGFDALCQSAVQVLFQRLLALLSSKEDHSIEDCSMDLVLLALVQLVDGWSFGRSSTSNATGEFTNSCVAELDGHFRLLGELIVMDNSLLVHHALVLIKLALEKVDRQLYRRCPDLISNLMRLCLCGSEDIVRLALESLFEICMDNEQVGAQLKSLGVKLKNFIAQYHVVSTHAPSIARSIYSLGIIYRCQLEKKMDLAVDVGSLISLLELTLRSNSEQQMQQSSVHVFSCMALAEIISSDPLLTHQSCIASELLDLGLSHSNLACRLALLRGLDRMVALGDQSNQGTNFADHGCQARMDYSSALCTLFQKHIKQISDSVLVAFGSSGFEVTNSPAYTSVLECGSRLLLCILRKGLSHPQSVLSSILAIWCFHWNIWRASSNSMQRKLALWLQTIGKDVLETHDSFLGIAITPFIKLMYQAHRSLGRGFVCVKQSRREDDGEEDEGIKVQSVFHDLLDSLKGKSRRVELITSLFREFEKDLMDLAVNDDNKALYAVFLSEAIAMLPLKTVDELALVLKRLSEHLALMEHMSEDAVAEFPQSLPPSPLDDGSHCTSISTSKSIEESTRRGPLLAQLLIMRVSRFVSGLHRMTLDQVEAASSHGSTASSRKLSSISIAADVMLKSDENKNGLNPLLGPDSDLSLDYSQLSEAVESLINGHVTHVSLIQSVPRSTKSKATLTTANKKTNRRQSLGKKRPVKKRCVQQSGIVSDESESLSSSDEDEFC